MQLNSNTLSSENPNLSIILEPHRSRRTKYSDWSKFEHVLSIVLLILIIAMLGSILHKQTELNKKIKKLKILVPDGKANFAWVPSSNGQVPEEAIPGGYTSTGEILYIGRKMYKGEMTPGKIHPSHDCLYISYNNDEHCYKDNYEVLVSRVGKASFAWVPSKNGQVPQEAIPGGYISNGEILYIGRKIYKGEMTPGKILLSEDCLYITYEGYEYCYKDNYEVLVSILTVNDLVKK